MEPVRIPKPVEARPTLKASAPLADRFSWRARHKWVAISFALWVALPSTITAMYMVFMAQPQYASTVAFAVHQANDNSAIELLSGFAEIQGSAAKHTDILHDYLQSQNMIEALYSELHLDEVWENTHDPIFGLSKDANIETLYQYSGRMVKTDFDPQTGLITVRSLAFTPEDAQKISGAILSLSQELVQKIPSQEKLDHFTQAEQTLEKAQADLIKAQTNLANFQRQHQIMDPTAQTASQVEFLTSLQHQKAQAVIDYDLLLSELTRPGDPRLNLAQRRINVIDDLITKERASLGKPENAAPKIAADFASLSLKLQFAQEAYLAARTAKEFAQTDM
ncbi:MAG: hypothetical protein ACWA40_05000, partial [Planktomarina sp.]